MSDGSRFPVSLLAQSKADRLAYFKSYTIAHPALKKLDERLRRIIEEPGDAGLIFVYGPTGVGKSTLMDRVVVRLGVEGAPESGSTTLPVLKMDALKSLANRSGTLLVLIGTYELLNFQRLSGQLSRRSLGLHFPRYGTRSEELKMFQSIVYGFQRQMPVMKEPELLKNWEYVYLRSLGCVGILKPWLVRALKESYENGEKTVTAKTLENCALSVVECEQIAAEMIAGEERLNEKAAGDPQRLSRMLGLSERVKDEKMSIEPSVMEKVEEVVALKPELRRRVGQPKPKRNDVP